MKLTDCRILFGSVVIILLSILIIFRSNYFSTPKKSSWVLYLNKATKNYKSGTFYATDKRGVQLTFKWNCFNGDDPAFIEKVIELRNIFAQSVLSFSMKLVKEHPETVFVEKSFYTLKPFFANGIDLVDWKSVEKSLIDIAKASFVKEEATYDDNDICWFVTVYENETIVGFAQFVVLPDDKFGYVRVPNIMLLPVTQHRGIGKLLLSSIFKILPVDVSVDVITLSVMNINTQAINAYKSYGFIGTVVNSDVLGGHSMAYITNKVDILQKEATKFK